MLTHTVVAQWHNKWSITCAVTCPTQDLTLPCFTPVTDSAAVSNAGIKLTSYPPPRADPQATNFFHQNSHPGDSFSVQNSGPRVEKTKQNPCP